MTRKTKYEVRFTSTAAQSIDDQEFHLADYIGAVQAAEKIDGLIDSIVGALTELPLAYPVSRQATELGITRYREFNIDEYRVFYESVEEHSQVAVLLVLRQKQSVERQLIQY